MTATRALWLLAFGAGCSGEAPPRPEWIVSVSTDAPLPQLGDRLLVETLRSDGQLACAECRRVLSAASVSDFPISFSIIPSGQRLLLRTRLYRSRATGLDGLPTSDQLIDQLGVLPETAGRSELQVNLALACFGVPVDFVSERSCSASSGLLAPFSPLSAQAPLAPVSSSAPGPSCGASPSPGMKCVPGGLFVLGDSGSIALSTDSDTLPEHLVRLSSFFLDEDEVSVGQVRGLIGRGMLSDVPAVRGTQSGRRACTYLGSSDARNDALPVNCVSRALAEEVCRARGTRLPTETEWEYAAGNRDQESLFPWGTDATTVCEHAVVGRVRLSLIDSDVEGDGVCIGQEQVLSEPTAGGNPLDITQLGIKNLGGNLSEYVADACAAYTAPCWSGSRILDNPRCDTPETPDFPLARRGGSWTSSLLNVPATARACVNRAPHGGEGTGFRCAQDAE